MLLVFTSMVTSCAITTSSPAEGIFPDDHIELVFQFPDDKVEFEAYRSRLIDVK